MSFKSSKNNLIICLLLAGCAYAPFSAHIAMADGVPDANISVNEQDRVQFSANNVSYDETGQNIIAEGGVEIVQNGKIVRADKVTYNLSSDKVVAAGHVVFLEPNGDVYFSDNAEFEQKLKQGYIKELRAVLKDGSRIKASEGHRIAGTVTEMKNAAYTPCEPCKKNPDKPPLWQLVADSVTLDEKENSVSYENARLEVKGVPVAYTPYFMHPDGTVEQKSGILPPKISLSSQTGMGVSSSYYYAINKSEDATIGARVFSKENPMLTGEYRRQFNNAEIELDGSVIHSNQTNNIRGHLSGEGLWDVNENWRAGFDGTISSDDKYMRQFDFSGANVLKNEIYAERFDNRDYFIGRSIAFQDVRVSDRSADQPNILPELNAEFIGDPDSFMGGRFDANLSMLDLVRKGNGQDVVRLATSLGWERRDVSDFGLTNRLRFNMAANGYQISDRDEISMVGGSGDAKAFRFYPLIHDEISYPLVKNVDNGHMVIEPKFSITASPHVKNNTDIPNEDSQDVQIDALNIFNENRYPGIDRVEDKTHMTYGVRTGVYGDNGNIGELFLGQSYRLNSRGSELPVGSGLSEQNSDIVAEMIARYNESLSINYKMQLDSETLSSSRHELDGNWVIGDLSLSGNYLYLRGLEGTDLINSRQQIYGAISYLFDEEWKVSTAARYDFSEEEEGLRYTEIGADYMGQCASLGVKARRSFMFSDTGENATEIIMQIGLKNLGTFGNEN